jgi:hypothetical protein
LQASGLGSFHMANEEPHSPKCDSKVYYLEPNKPANGSDFPFEVELLQVTFEIRKIAFGRGLFSIVHMARSNSMGVMVILARCSIRLRWLSMQFPFHQTSHGSGEAFRIWPSLSQLRHTRRQTNCRSVRIA